MDCLAFPLRVGPDGRLARTDRVDALLGLVRVMAATSARVWTHAPWFGLHETFGEANPALEDHPRLADALNRALEELKIGWARVDSVRLETRGRFAETRHFDVTLRLDDGDFRHGRVESVVH
ncbi:MAG: hypothetical protein R3E98_02410 [Gemmatimonadota bacterium]|nr:hypothetical protein [Gemmatimonadota bacterium]